MTDKQYTADDAAAPVCGTEGSGLKCAVVSWVMPLLAVGILALGLRFPAVRAVNILVVAFGVTALLRSYAHMRQFGGCGLGGHVVAGTILNAIVLVLVVLYVFFGIDGGLLQ
jgi:hypothetical protein